MSELKIPQYEISIVTQPEIAFVRFTELREFITQLLSKYKGLVISEDQVKEIKKEIAELNKIKAEIKSYAKKIIAELTRPIDRIDEYTQQVTVEIDATYSALKQQIDAYAEDARAKKEEYVRSVFKSLCAKFHMDPFDIQIKSQWTNKSTSNASIERELSALIQERIAAENRQKEAARAQQVQQTSPQPQLVPTPARAEEQKKAPATTPEPTQPTRLDHRKEQKEVSAKSSGMSSEIFKMTFVVAWTADVDTEIREHLRAVKALASRFSARSLAAPTQKPEAEPTQQPQQASEPTPKPQVQPTPEPESALEPEPVITEQVVKFCYTCEKFKSTSEGEGVCGETGEVVSSMSVCHVVGK